MFKTFAPPEKKKTRLPRVADFQAAARMPAKVWGLAKVALILWVILGVAGLAVRIAAIFRPVKVSRTPVDAQGQFPPQPVYAIWNFNFVGGGQTLAPKADKAPQE